MSASPLDKVIVALDYEEPDTALRLVDQIGDLVSWFKIGPILYTRSGPDVIRSLHRKGKKIFIDMKLHDTPQVVADTIKQFADMGAQFATVHTMGGKTMLEAASRGCRGSQLKLIGLTLLTSHQPEDSAALGWTDNESDIVLKMLETALSSRLAGIMCSPHDIDNVRKRVLPGFVLVTPGIRLQGQEVFQDDQKRVATPQEALGWGSDYLIIGRPITQARDPRLVVQSLF